MKQVKKIVYFITGLFVVPAVMAYLTAFILKIDIFSHALWECLCVDYILAYALTPLSYRRSVLKYIRKRYVLFALIFLMFWFWEIIRIQLF